jgi:hypothetical protein
VFDIGDPNAPIRVGKASSHAVEMTGIASAGPCLLCCYGFQGAGIIDRTFESTFAPVATAPSLVAAQDIVADGELAAASYVYDVQLFDISNLGQPIPLGVYSPPETASEVAIQGPYLYMMDGDANLTVVDATNPLLPEAVSTTSLGSFFSEGRMYADGSILWVSIPSPKVLRAIDISNPQSPTILGTTPIPFAGELLRVDDIMYVGLKASGLSAVDVSNVAMPQVLATFPSIPTQALWIEDDPIASMPHTIATSGYGNCLIH